MRAVIFFLGLILAVAPVWAGGSSPVSGSPVVGPDSPFMSPAEPKQQAVLDAEDGDIIDAAPVLVSGRHSGPGLWKVSHGDNVLWILGTVSPVPRKMDWYSPQAEQVLAQASEIIGPPGVVVSMGAGSMFKAVFSLPTLLKARNNPDDATLRDVLPADLYSRWERLKPLYLGRDKGVEKMRPFFAAGELYDAALKQAGLQYGSGVGTRLSQLAKQHRIKRTPTSVRAEIKNPRSAAKAFIKAEMDDIACFRSMLDHLDADVLHAAERANAWAVGDLPALSRLLKAREPLVCLRAFTGTEMAKSLGLDDGEAVSRKQWFDAVDAALKTNAVSFATMPVADLLGGDLPAVLREKGYAVKEPGRPDAGGEVEVDAAAGSGIDHDRGQP